jgi:excisionase family DNA binding protein
MPPEKTKKSIAPKPTQRILDEAPLFAGLDGFVIQQHEKVVADTHKKTIKEKQKKKPATKKPTKTVKAEGSKSPSIPIPARVTKPQKPTAIDADAILLSIREMCTLLKISRATLVRMDNAGKIPGRMKLGGSVRFHRATVVAWLESMIAPANTPF